jgi:hypothetical protein
MPPKKKGKKSKEAAGPLDPLVKRSIAAKIHSEQLQDELQFLQEENRKLKLRRDKEKEEFDAKQRSLHKDIDDTRISFQGAAIELESCYGDTQDTQQEFRSEYENQCSILKGQDEQLAKKEKEWKHAKGPLDVVRGKNENMKDHLDGLKGHLTALLTKLNKMDTDIAIEIQRNAIVFVEPPKMAIADAQIAYSTENSPRNPITSKSASSKSLKLPAYQRIKVNGSNKAVTFDNKNKEELSQSISMPNLAINMRNNAKSMDLNIRSSRRRNSALTTTMTTDANQAEEEDRDDRRDPRKEDTLNDGQIYLMIDGEKVHPSRELSRRSYECEVPSLVILLLRIISKSKNRAAQIENVASFFQGKRQNSTDSLENDSDVAESAPLGSGGGFVLKNPILITQRPLHEHSPITKQRWKQSQCDLPSKIEDKTIPCQQSPPLSLPDVPKVVQDLLSAIECMMLASVEERTASAMNKIQGVQVILDTMARFESPGVHAQATKLLWKILMHSPSKSKTLLAKNGIHHLSKTLQMYCFVPAVHITAIECLNAILPAEYIEATQRHGGENVYAELMKQNVSNRRNAVVLDLSFAGGRGSPKELAAKKGMDYMIKQGTKSFHEMHKEGNEPLVQILRYKTDRMKSSALRKIDSALLELHISHAEISSLNMGKAIRVMFATLLFCVQQATTTKRKGDPGWAEVQEVFVLRSKSIAYTCEALYILMLKDEHSYVDELMSHPKQLGILLRILNDFFNARKVVIASCRIFCVMLANKKLSREEMVDMGLPGSVKRGVAAHAMDPDLHAVSAPILEYFGDKARQQTGISSRSSCGPASPSIPTDTRTLRRSAVGVLPPGITGLLPSIA